MDIIDNETVVVYNTADLRDAVSTDNGISYIYFGADIELEYGITIFPGKPTLIIDGFYPLDGTGVIHKFTDMHSADMANTLGVRASSSINLTIKNMNMQGWNYYGIPCFIGGSGQNNVVMTYNNVTYAGPQITYNPNGLTNFIDCNITILQGTTEPQEVAESNRVVLGGTVNINKTNDIHSVFYFRGTSGTAYLEVLPDANVIINTNNYFMYTAVGAVPYTINAGAKLTLNTRRGICESSGHRVSTFTVGEGALFKYIQAEANGSTATLYINGAFTVNKAANVYMQANYDGVGPLIRFAASTGALNIINPKSFVLYKRGAAAITFANEIPCTFSGGQLNYWDIATPFPQAGTLSDIPTRKWNKDKYATFIWSGRVSSAQTSMPTHNFTQEELDSLPPLTDLRVQDARVLSIGDLPLMVNAVVERKPVTGTTEAGAYVLIEYIGNSADTWAGATGGFSVNPLTPIPFAASVTISANTPFLITIVTEISRDEGELVLQSAPDLITFILSSVSTVPELLLAREYPDAEVVVYDSRVESTPWKLMASIDRPLQTESGHTETVVYADDIGITQLGAQPIPVYWGEENEGDPKTTKCQWAYNRGILLHVTEPIFNSEKYTAKVIWDILPD